MKKIGFAERLDKVVTTREKGNPWFAIALFTELELEAAAALRFDDWADAAMQRIICYQHMYEKTSEESLRQAMMHIAGSCEQFATKHRVATGRIRIFQYRQGVGAYLGGKYTIALGHFSRALKNLPESDFNFPEFAGYYGSALALSKKSAKGLDWLKVAINATRNDNRRKPAHQKVVLAGLYMKMARAAWHLKEKQLTDDSMGKASTLANELVKKHGYTQRLEQFKSLKKELGQ